MALSSRSLTKVPSSIQYSKIPCVREFHVGGSLRGSPYGSSSRSYVLELLAMPAFCARVERFMILLPNTPSSSARSRTRFASVNSLRNEPIHFGFGSPITLLRESLHVPWLSASRIARVAPMSAVLLLRRYLPRESVSRAPVTQLRAA